MLLLDQLLNNELPFSISNNKMFAENLDGGEYLFAFRMLMVLFRREFTFIDTMYLWEVRFLDNVN